jgi:hypothetical protein
LTPAGYTRRVQEIENRLDDWLDDWLDGLPRTMSPELSRLDNHIRAHRGEGLVFLHDAEVPPTNNYAEQMLRPAVITRRVGGCNKTLWGATRSDDRPAHGRGEHRIWDQPPQSCGRKQPGCRGELSCIPVRWQGDEGPGLAA